MDPGSSIDTELIEATILNLTTARGAEKTICPSEVARHLAPDAWRPLMAPVREAAGRLQQQGVIQITQGGAEVDIDSISGPIRLGIVHRQESD